MSPPSPTDLHTLQDRAWIGDAVLCLYAREWLLNRQITPNSLRTDLFTHFTSNHFLAALGDPTHVEAEIGAVYQHQGLAAAYDHITQAILPLYLKQIRNRLRGTRHQTLLAQLAPDIDDQPRSV